MVKKILVGIGAACLLVAGGSYGAWVYYQNRAVRGMESALAYLSPSGAPLYDNLTYSFWPNTISVSGLVFPGSQGMTIERLTVHNPNRESARIVFDPVSYVEKIRRPGMLPLADSIVIEGLKNQEVGPYQISLGKVTIERPTVRQLQQAPRTLVAPFDMSSLKGEDFDYLAHYIPSFLADGVDVEDIKIKSTRRARPEDGLWNVPLLTLGHAYTLQLERLSFGGMDGVVLKSLTLDGLNLDGERYGHVALEGNTRRDKGIITARLKKLSFENIDMRGVSALINAKENDIWGHMVTGLDAGKLTLDGFSAIRERTHFFDTQSVSDADAAIGESETTDAHSKELVEIILKELSLVDLSKGILAALQVEDFSFTIKTQPEEFGDVDRRYQIGLLAVKDFDLGRFSIPFLAELTGYGSALDASLDQFFTPVNPEKLVLQKILWEEKVIGSVLLDELVGASEYTDGIMTNASVRFEGLKWEFPAATEDDSANELQRLGYRKIFLSGQGKEKFSPDSRDYRLSLAVRGREMGSISLNFDLGKYPRKKKETLRLRNVDEYEVLQRMQAVLRGIEFQGTKFSYSDDTLVERVVETLAENQGVSEDDVRREVIGSLLSLAESLIKGSDAATPTIQAALDGISRFIVEPKTISMSVRPQKPALFGQLEKYVREVTPEEMLTFLNFTVSTR